MKITVNIVNAFTAHGTGGNKAGVVFDADSLDTARMLAIAQKLNFSETAFVSNSRVADYRLRFFTITDEVDLCGHATIATWLLLRQQGRVTRGTFKQETRAGLLDVEIDADDVVFMEQAKPEFLGFVGPEKVAAVLRADPNTLRPQLPSQIVSTGLKDLLIAVKDKAALDALQPDFPAMVSLSNEEDITGLHVFTLGDNASESLACVRNFFPRFGVNEEAATGTSNGALLCYLKNRAVLPSTNVCYRIEQGQAMGALSYIYGKFRGEAVWIGGNAKATGQHIMEI